MKGFSTSILLAFLLIGVVSAQECYDIPPQGDLTCAERKANDGCEKDWMISGDFCAVTCGRCSDPKISEDCGDVQPEGDFTCAQRATFGACDKDWMIDGNYCEKTCGRCFLPSDCFDITAPTTASLIGGSAPSCEQRKQWGGCDSDYLRLNNYCAATCGFCGEAASTPAPVVTPTIVIVPTVEVNTGPEDEEADAVDEEDITDDITAVQSILTSVASLRNQETEEMEIIVSVPEEELDVSVDSVSSSLFAPMME
eukprot:TRINITY_DN332_c1_g1_i1.p2 TRINITY_DN332_c1_g1~~TRINITY_DN332_c1_g1_i1.p2  ORF type:complete len:254 (+),score=49.32 TRINITY_DN332_c1_g1_i1:181-942(+)